jgi:carbon storage regulator
MLVLSRRLGEKIILGNNICVTLVELHRNRVKLGITAPAEVIINRPERCSAETGSPGSAGPSRPGYAHSQLI